MEYADKGDLYGEIQDMKKKGSCFSELDIWKVLI
jgi:hypothetical protein